MRLRFTVRDLLWLAAVVALAVGWWLDHRAIPGPIVVTKDSQGNISLNAAKRLIASGEVIGAIQAHSHVVGIVLKDGTEYRCKEIEIDEVSHYIDACGLSDKIIYLTE